MLQENLKVIRKIFLNVKSIFIFLLLIAVATTYVYFSDKDKHKYRAIFNTSSYYELNHCFPLFKRFATIRIIDQKITMEKNLKKFSEIKKLDLIYIDVGNTNVTTIIFEEKKQKEKNKINFDDLEKQIQNLYIELANEFFEIQLKFKEMAKKTAIDTLNELKNFETISVKEILELNESYSVIQYCNNFFNKNGLGDQIDIKIEKKPTYNINFIVKVYLGTLLLYLLINVLVQIRFKKD